MINERMEAAALLVANLVPNAVETGVTGGPMLRKIEPHEYARLSSGERAAYELALDLWDGAGALARYVAFADDRYAGVLCVALTIALGDRLVPIPEPAVKKHTASRR